MGGCQNYGPLLGPLNTRCRIILRTQQGTIILKTTPMHAVQRPVFVTPPSPLHALSTRITPLPYPALTSMATPESYPERMLIQAYQFHPTGRMMRKQNLLESLQNWQYLFLAAASRVGPAAHILAVAFAFSASASA